MVKSILDPKINYREMRDLDAEDKEYEASVYETEILGIPVVIALGQAKYAFIEDNVIYFPIYLVKNQKVDTQIGVYEVLADRMPNILDEDGDPDVMLMGRPLLYSFVTPEMVKGDSEQSDEGTKKTGTDKKPESDDSVDDSQEDADESESDEDGDADEESLGFSPLPEQDAKMAADERSEFKGKEVTKKTPWIQKYLRNSNFEIIDNEGGGDCLFATIRDGLAKVGRNVSVQQMRQMLAAEATEDLFQGYKAQYDMAIGEYQQLAVEIRTLAAEHRQLKARLKKSKDRSIQAAVVAQAEEVGQRHAIAKAERTAARELIDEFKFMKGITTLEAFKAKIQTCGFWGETWAISTLERVLNIKLILFSREAYNEGDIDNVLQCGQLNDNILSEKGIFEPTQYIMSDFLGDHYELITYKERGAFTFDEIPYDVKKLVVDKCLERAAGPYYIIPQFREFMDKIQVVVSDPTPEISPLYDDATVFQFYSKSADKPKPGRGSGESVGPEGVQAYVELAAIPKWRKKLSNFWAEEFEIDGKKWLSVEHYYQGSKFKKSNPAFYETFSLDSGSALSKDPLLAKKAGGKSAPSDVRPSEIVIDADFFGGRHEESMEDAMRAKFTQNPDLGTMLRATKRAKLQHFSRGSPPVVFDNLMRVRETLVEPNP